MIYKNTARRTLFLAAVIIMKTLATEPEIFTIPQQHLSLVEDAWNIKEKYLWHSYYRLSLNGKAFRGTRPWVKRWNLIKAATNFANKRILDLGCNIGLNPIFLQKYGHASHAVGIDIFSANIKRARILAQAFESTATFKQIDLDHDNYEKILGFDYDIVFCMSVYKWVNSKERLLNYLSKFKKIIVEGHDSIVVERVRYARIGFTQSKFIGMTDLNRPLILFYK